MYRSKAKIYMKHDKKRCKASLFYLPVAYDGNLKYDIGYVYLRERYFTIMEKRERLGSRLGFIMLSAGCAIGCGNVWKFPWACGQNGGGSFMLIYIICLLVLGLPAMVMELSVGRAAQTSPLYMYQKLSVNGKKWRPLGIVCLIGNIALIAFYSVVSGWIIYYFVKFLTGQNQNFGFEKMIADPSVNVTYLLVTVIIAFVILSFNLQGGLERVTKYMFPACYTYGLEVNAGPSLLFDTMASVFNHMNGGRWWGALFFLFMVFAALSTVLGVCENILAMIRELTGWSRPVGCLVCGIGSFLIALTTALGYSVVHFQPFSEGTAWLDFWDFIVSTNVMPLGSLALALFCCNRFGWGWDNFIKEANAGKGWKVQEWMKPVFRYFVPAVILFIYVYGMVTFKWK